MLISAPNRAGSFVLRVRELAAAVIVSIPLIVAAQSPPPDGSEDLVAVATGLTRQGDFANAIVVLKRALRRDPQNADANFMLGMALLQSGFPAEAVDPLRIAVTIDPRNEAAAGYLGDAEMELKDFASAAQTFQLAVARSNGSEQSLAWWTDFSLERFRVLQFSLRATSAGRSQMMIVASQAPRLDLQTRLSLLTQAASLDPSANGVLGDLGIVQVSLGALTDAEASLAAALRKQPAATSTLQLKCLVDAANGQWADAENLALSIGERSAASLRALADRWPRSLVPPAGVKGAFWDCIRNQPADCPTAITVPASSRPTPDHDFAEQRWESLAAMPAPTPDRLREWFWRGMAFAALGDCSQAIPALERGLDPGAEVAAARLSHCYESEAVRAADRLAAQGNDASVHKIRGDIQLSIHLDPVRAEAEYKAALVLKPDDPEILEKIAEADFSQGEMKASEDAAEKALAMAPQRTQILQLLVRIAMANRDYSKAIVLLQKLLRQQPANQWAQVQDAIAHAETGQPAEAVQKLQAALHAGYPDANGSLHALLSTQLRKLGRTDEAQAANRAAIRLADSQQQSPQRPEKQP